MTLYFLRHGDVAEYAPDDAHRVLSGRGEQQARIAGNALVSMGITLYKIISSPLTRAQQTAKHISEVGNAPLFSVSPCLLPESNPRDILVELNALPGSSVLLVGHEPQLRKMVSLPLGNSAQMNLRLTNGCLGCISIPQPLSEGKGTFLWFMTNEQMELILH